MSLTYPGVYVYELSGGVHTIAAVATSITAFVGYAPTGPENQPVTLFSFRDYERVFGGLAADSEMSYAVQQFYANLGTQAIVVRVPGDGAGKAVLPIHAADLTSSSLTLQAQSTGAWAGSVVVFIDYEGLDDSDPLAFNLTTMNTATNETETFGRVTVNTSRPNYVTRIVNDPDAGSRLVTVTAPAATATTNPPQPARSGIISATVTLGTGSGSVFDTLKQPSKSAGFKIALDSDAPIEVTLFTAADKLRPTSPAQLYQILQSRTGRALQAKYPGAQVRVTEVKSALSVPTADSLCVVVRVPARPDAIATFTAGTGFDIDVAATMGLTTPALANVATYWMGTTTTGTTKAAKGAQGQVTLGGDGDGPPGSVALIGDELTFTGIYALDKVDLFNILCIPDATRAQAGNPSRLDDQHGDTRDVDPNAIFAEAMTYCKKRRAFLLIDPPPQVDDVASAVNWKTAGLTVHDLNGAAYFPRLRFPDPLDNMRLRTFAPCGVVAGLYAATDANRKVWKAPAGIAAQLSGVRQLVYTLSDDENGVLNPLGLNCLRRFPIYNFVSWGARTLVGADADASEWKYVPVRRLALFLEESLYRGLQWVVFEPNDEPLWTLIRLNVGAFMQTLFRQGAFQGSTPQQAYFVACDSSTTTQVDIDAGVVNIRVGFAPLKPAEFVVLQLQQIAGQIQT